MKSSILRTLGIALLVAGVAGLCQATPLATPEIDGATAGNALALLGGILLVIRSRKR
jgi:hypothetical protein